MRELEDNCDVSLGNPRILQRIELECRGVAVLVCEAQGRFIAGCWYHRQASH